MSCDNFLAYPDTLIQVHLEVKNFRAQSPLCLFYWCVDQLLDNNLKYSSTPITAKLRICIQGLPKKLSNEGEFPTQTIFWTLLI